MKIKSAVDNNKDIAAGVITVNSVFAHLIKEIDTKGMDMTYQFYH